MSTPPHALQLSSSNNNNRSLSSGGSYSQTLDQLLGFGARPPVPGSRRLPEMNSNERPTTRHGNRSSSSNATSSSSSSKHKENGHSQQSVDSSEHYTTSKLSEISSFQRRPVLSPVQSSSGATTSLNVWSREEDNDLLDDNKSNQTTSRHSNQSDEDDDDEVDEFTRKLQSLANRTMQARNSLVASSNGSQTLLLNKKPSVIMEKGENSLASSSSSTSACASPKLNGKNIVKNQASADSGASERRQRRSSALLANSVTQESFIEPNYPQKSLVKNGSGSTAVASSVRRLSQPKIRSSSANTAKEKTTAKGKPWGSNINGKEQNSNKRSTNTLSRPISTTIASLSGAFPSQLEGGSQRAISTTSSSYDAWLKHKIEENKKKKLALKEKQEEEERKRKEKKMDAEKSFQRWKKKEIRKLTRKEQN
uniref:Uncharacterized protein n=1 Tax=Ditylenchus dipsaci TaxID=166011 RepID=A0A915EF76_9BILA